MWQHPEEELGELGEQLDAEDDGLGLGLDALDHLDTLLQAVGDHLDG